MRRLEKQTGFCETEEKRWGIVLFVALVALVLLGGRVSLGGEMWSVPGGVVEEGLDSDALGGGGDGHFRRRFDGEGGGVGAGRWVGG